MIAEQTSEREEPPEADLDAASPLASLTARINEFNRRASSTAPAPAAREAASDTAFDRLHAAETRTAGLIEAVMRRNADAEARTVQMIEQLARSSRETEAKAANALAAVTRWIETAERGPGAAVDAAGTADRAEAAAVRPAARRPEPAEARPAKIGGGGAQPIRNAIEKLDERLTGLMEQAPAPVAAEDLARTATDLERRLAELAAEPAARHAATEDRAEHAARIESKLSRILDTLASRHEAAGGERPAPNGQPISLDRAIEQISNRQRSLESPAATPTMPVWPPRPIRPPRDPAEIAFETGLDGVKGQIAALTLEISKLRQAGQPRPPVPDPAISALRDDIGAVSRNIATLASTGGLDAIESRIAALAERIDGLRQGGASEAALRAVETHLEEIARSLSRLAQPDVARLESDLKAMSGKLDRIAAQTVDAAAFERLHRRFDEVVHQPRPELARLEGNLKGIAGKLDQLAAGGVDPALIETLNRRIEDLARFGVTVAAPQPLNLAADPAITALRDDIAEVSRALTASASSSGLEVLENRIAGLADRVDDLRLAGASENALQSVEGQLVEIARAVSNLDLPDIAGMQGDLRAVAEKLDRLIARGIDNGAVQRLQAQAEEILDLVGQAARPDAIDALARRVDELGLRLDRINATIARQAPLAQAAISTAPLETMIRQLAEKLDQAQRPGADERSLDALEQQINRMAERLEAAGSPSPDLGTIERSIADLFEQLQETRAATLDVADDAAARAVRQAVAQFPSSAAADPLPDEVRRSLDDIRSAQDDLGRRTEVTLEAVRATLERLTERMGAFERAAAPVARPAPEPMPAFAAPRRAEPAADAADDPAGRPAAAGFDSLSPAAPSREIFAGDLSLDVPLEPGTGAPRPLSQTVDPRAGKAALSTGADARRAEFIQAARRAAQAAALEAQSMSQKGKTEPEPEAAEPEPETPVELTPAPAARAGRTRLRGALKKNRVPILLGLAAAVMMLGAYQVYERAGISGGDETSAVLPAPAAPEGGPAAEPSAVPAPQSELEPPKTQPSAEAEPKPQSALPETARPPATVAAAIAQPESAPAPEAASPPPPVDLGVPSLGAAMLPPPDEPAPAVASVDVPERLQAAAKANDPRALFDLATRLAGQGSDADLKAAAQLYERAGEKGFAPAQYRLGSMYEKGLGVTQDFEQARTLYQRAAGKGNIKAMHNLAVLYAEGAVGGKPDYATAAQWFRQAAEHGLRDSEYNYAILAARGLGSSSDLAEAYKWFSLAAAQGDVDAGKKRDDVARRLDAATLAAQQAAVAAFRPQDAPVMANEATLPAVSWADPGGQGA